MVSFHFFDVLFDENVSDLTPANEGELEVVDNYLLDNTIIHFIQSAYEEVSPSWYSQDEELALDYFTPPNFPPVAIAGLGYPAPGASGGDEEEGAEEAPENEEN